MTENKERAGEGKESCHTRMHVWLLWRRKERRHRKSFRQLCSSKKVPTRPKGSPQTWVIQKRSPSGRPGPAFASLLHSDIGWRQSMRSTASVQTWWIPSAAAGPLVNCAPTVADLSGMFSFCGCHAGRQLSSIPLKNWSQQGKL